MSSIAIVQTAFIGDVVLVTPLLESARASRPDDRIIAVVRSGCDNLLGNNPFVDEIVVWDKHNDDRGIQGIFRCAKRLRQRQVELALIPHRSLRTALMLRLSGARTTIGFRKGGGTFLHTINVPYKTGIHEVKRNLMLAEAAGWKTEGYVPKIFPDDTDRDIVEDIAGSLQPFCVLAPGSVWKTKRWPVESYISVGCALMEKGLQVVVSGGTSDESVCGSLANGVPGAVNVCGLLSLRQSAELYRQSSFILTGDSAPQHIAAAMGTHVFSIFGPTVCEFGFWPYTNRGVVIEENMDCRPCGIHGHRECPEGTHRCMRAVTPERVIKIIEEKIEN